MILIPLLANHAVQAAPTSELSPRVRRSSLSAGLSPACSTRLRRLAPDNRGVSFKFVFIHSGRMLGTRLVISIFPLFHFLHIAARCDRFVGLPVTLPSRSSICARFAEDMAIGGTLPPSVWLSGKRPFAWFCTRGAVYLLGLPRLTAKGTR